MNSSRLGRRRLAVALLSLAPLGAPLFAQTTATTTPVGFVTLTVPGAASPSAPSNKALAVSLYNAPAFTAAVASVDSNNSLTLTGAAWAANQFTTNPHFIRVRNGANAGRFFLVSGHTTNQLTVDTRGTVLSSVIGVNDSCEILPAHTLGSLFGTTTPIVQTGATANVADNVFLWNGTTWDTYYHNGTNWRKSGSLANQNGVVVYPDEGLFIARVATAPLTLTVMGTVPSSTESTELDSGSTFVANRFPVDMQLSSIGLHQTANWTSGTNANSSDNVFVWNGTTWDTYYYNGTNWRKSGSLANQDTTVIPSGTAMFVKRAAATPAVLTQPLPYAP